MTEIENKKKNKYLETFKWYAVGCLVSLLAYFAMRFFKMDIHNISGVFQASCGILLGGLLQMRTRLPANK